MAEVKLKGTDNLVRLMKKPDLWVPPANTANYLGFVLKVLTSSRYKDLFMKLAPEDLHSALKIKVARCFFEGTLDLEEIVDLGAYATLLYLRTAVLDLVDPKSTAKEMMGQLRDMSCGVMKFKQELDKSPKVEVKETPPSPTPEIGTKPANFGINYAEEVKRMCAEWRSEELERVKAEQTQMAPKRSPADEKFLHDFGFGSSVKTENDNCLLDMKCPKCGSLEPFDIRVTCWTKVYDDGTDTANEHNWDNASLCNCFKCNYAGRVRDFRVSLPPEKVEVIGTTLLGVKHGQKAKKPKKKGAKCRTSKRTCSSTKRR